MREGKILQGLGLVQAAVTEKLPLYFDLGLGLGNLWGGGRFWGQRGHIRLNAENQLPWCPGSCLNVCVDGV